MSKTSINRLHFTGWSMIPQLFQGMLQFLQYWLLTFTISSKDQTTAVGVGGCSDGILISSHWYIRSCAYSCKSTHRHTYTTHTYTLLYCTVHVNTILYCTWKLSRMTIEGIWCCQQSWVLSVPLNYSISQNRPPQGTVYWDNLLPVRATRDKFRIFCFHVHN